tara:strand:+ start:4683 stop:5045 length:363 start_codon:yes stop_codon:yes gene_type:complete
MAYNEKLVDRLREALVDVPLKVEEKKMFQGFTFMVDDKMCIGVRNNEIMCRVGPEVYADVLERTGCRPMVHGKRTIKGYVFVEEEGYKREADFNFWIQCCLEFNKKAKPSPKKKRNPKQK